MKLFLYFIILISSPDPRSIDLKDLVHNAADATVPPGPEGQNVTLWDQYSYPESHKNK